MNKEFLVMLVIGLSVSYLLFNIATSIKTPKRTAMTELGDKAVRVLIDYNLGR